jgi:hypothetical protein
MRRQGRALSTAHRRELAHSRYGLDSGLWDVGQYQEALTVWESRNHVSGAGRSSAPRRPRSRSVACAPWRGWAKTTPTSGRPSSTCYVPTSACLTPLPCDPPAEATPEMRKVLLAVFPPAVSDPTCPAGADSIRRVWGPTFLGSEAGSNTRLRAGLLRRPCVLGGDYGWGRIWPDEWSRNPPGKIAPLAVRVLRAGSG